MKKLLMSLFFTLGIFTFYNANLLCKHSSKKTNKVATGGKCTTDNQCNNGDYCTESNIGYSICINKGKVAAGGKYRSSEQCGQFQNVCCNNGVCEGPGQCPQSPPMCFNSFCF